MDAVISKENASIPVSLTSSAAQYDVVVPGAGLAGLTAAETLIRAGYSCLVLEARDRVGGRTWSSVLPSGDGIVDLGTAWINDTNQSRVYELVRRAHSELIEQNITGNCLLQDSNGDRLTFKYGELPVRSH